MKRELTDREKGMLLGAYYGDIVDTHMRGTKNFSIGTFIRNLVDVVDMAEIHEFKHTMLRRCIEWSKTCCSDWENFNSLFRNVDSVKEYKERYNVRFPSNSVKNLSITNEALVRAIPLALVKNTDRRSRMIKVNNAITTPSKVSEVACTIYITALRYCINRINAYDIIDRVEDLSYDVSEIHTMFYNLKNDIDVDLEEDSCINSMYCALKALATVNDKSPTDIIKDISETYKGRYHYGCVVGAVIGAYVGYNELMSYDDIKNKNISV